MTTLIIARHGNTFEPDDTPTRIGARTDLPLVESGQKQARRIGAWLKDNNLFPEIVYTSHLQRTIETAKLAIKETGIRQPVFPLDIFNEIDYGPDENKTEEDVIARLGEQAIQNWNDDAIVPDGWLVDPDQIIENWKNFASHIVKDEQDIIMVVTSNGTARFAPHITGDFESFKKERSIKLSTGALAVFQHENNQWAVKEWNIRP